MILRPVLLLSLAAMVAGLAALPAQPPALAAQASISGVVWEDRNADGVRQPDEPGFEIEVTLAGPSGEQTILSDDDGRYGFTDLGPGPYTVAVPHVHASFYLTAPARLAKGSYQVSVTLATEPIEMNFGLYGTLNLPVFSGLAWKNAERVAGPGVAASIGGRDCTGPGGIQPPDQDPATYQISVASAALIPDCGEPGDTISFTIDGEAANETVEWQVIDIPLPDPNESSGIVPPPGTGPAPVQTPSPTNFHRFDLTIGPPFAWWVPFVEGGDAIDDPELYVEAFIGDTLCGRAENPGNPAVLLVVPSAELKPGCGSADATVAFTVKGAPVAGQAIWQPGDQGVLRLNIPPPDVGSSQAATTSEASTGATITPPDTGDAGLLR